MNKLCKDIINLVIPMLIYLNKMLNKWWSLLILNKKNLKNKSYHDINRAVLILYIYLKDIY